MSYIKPVTSKHTAKKMLSLVSKKQVICMMAYGIAGGILPLLSVLAMQVILASLTKSNQSMKGTLIIIGIYTLIGVILQIVEIQTEIRTYASFNHIRMNTLKELVTKYMTMDLSYYENKEFMDEAESAFSAVETNGQGFEGIYHRVFTLSKKVVSAILLGILIWFLNPAIIAVVILYICINIYLLKVISKYRYSRRVEQNEANRRTGVYSFESADFAYGKDIRLFSMNERLMKAYKNEIKNLAKILKDISGLEIKVSFVDVLFLIICNFTAYIILVNQLYEGMSIAGFIMYLTAITLFIGTMADISKDVGFIRQQFVYCKDMFGLLDMNLITEDKENSFVSESPIKVEFRNVSFHYPNSEKMVYEHLNLVIEPSKKVALVGVNGAGKTTLVKLITGLYRPTSGQILINGIDYTTFQVKDLQQLFGVVFQDVNPLAVKVKENVAAAKKDINEERVQEVLEMVGLWPKINEFEKNMDTMLLKIIDENGIVLSGGENQKLMIARALYRENTKMMIMDEPTAALDAIAEEKIYTEFNSIMSGKTGLFISHRLASTRFCDYIILLNGGKIEEIGTHDELIEANNLYAEMFKTQGKYYQEENHEEK